MTILKIRINNKTLKIKNCKGISSLKGLMFDKVEDKDGALIYGNKIWMPFCVPLDLYFLDENFVIIEKQEAVPLTLNPKTWKSYYNSKAKYCLELRHDIKITGKRQKVRLII